MLILKKLILPGIAVCGLATLTACGSNSSQNPSSTDTQTRMTTKGPASANETLDVNLGIARNYNLFLFGDLNQPSADTEGSIAVGGNATLSNYSVGDVLEQDPQRYDLVVGGDLHFSSGSVSRGSAIVAGKITKGSTSFYGGVKHGHIPVDFAQAKAELRAESERLSKIQSTGQVKFQDWNQERGELVLEGSDLKANVFEVDVTLLSRTHTLVITSPHESKVLVNVRGAKASIKSLGMTVQGTTRNRILFNFVDAKSLEISEISFEGSVLAPYADIQFPTGVLRGQLIAQSLRGRGQINHDPIHQPNPPTSPPPPQQPPTLPDNPEVPYR